MDADSNDIAASGLTNCLTRDGQGQPTANLPMAGFHHTGALAGSASGQYLTYEQMTGGSPLAITATNLTVTGEASINGTFSVAGNAAIAGNETVGGSFTVTGIGGFLASASVASSLSVGTALNVGTTLNVTGGVGFSSFLNVAGTTILSGVLNCNGATVLSNTGPYMVPSGATTTPTAWTYGCGINASGGIAATGFMTVSDQRMKTEIADITPADGVDWVRRGRPRTYLMDGKPSSGFIAQEDIASGRHAAVLSIPDERPEFAVGDAYAAPGQRLVRDYLHDIAYLTAALQSALSRIDILEKGLKP